MLALNKKILLNNYMPAQEEIKEAYRLFFLVKGHLNCTQETALGSADGYFRRLWMAGSNGAPLYEYEEQFEKAWREKNLK
jgi:hypothetical protein